MKRIYTTSTGHNMGMAGITETWSRPDMDGVMLRHWDSDTSFHEEFISNKSILYGQRNLTNRNPVTGRFEKILYNEIYQ